MPAVCEWMRSASGTYALVLRSGARTRVQIGRWGMLDVRPGYYLYVGSAFGPGGVLARVSRHCREAKSKHWHIDYLREVTTPVSIWCSYARDRLEHSWAEALAKMGHTAPIKGFGCSDCACEAHLFFTTRKPSAAEFVAVAGGPIESCSCPHRYRIGGAGR